MPRVLSKKMKPKSKKGVSWNQMGINRKLIGKSSADELEITESLKELEETKDKISLQGFNSVESCPNCNKPIIKGQSVEISRHEFMNPYEFTDKALLEELIIRIKKGCIEIKKTKKDDWTLEEECRWDLARGLKKDEKTGELVKDEKVAGNYSVSIQELVDIQERQEKLTEQDRICDICLEREKDTKEIFCKPCLDRETKSRVLRLKSVKKAKKVRKKN